MSDPHQINSIIAAAICGCRKDDADDGLKPEFAKHMAKCITEALASAGLKIVPSAENKTGE